MLISWTGSSVSIRRGLYFFTHENPAQQLFSPYAKPSHGAHYQELKYINQRNWFVHVKQNIFCFCQLRKWHLPLMPLCWFFQAFDFYELRFWAWWLQLHCGSEQHAGLPEFRGPFFLCLRLLSRLGSLGSSCSEAPSHESRCPTRCCSSSLVHCGCYTSLFHRGLLSHLSFLPFHFISSFSIFCALLTFLSLTCTCPRCLFQAASPQVDVSRGWCYPGFNHSRGEPLRASKHSPLPHSLTWPFSCYLLSVLGWASIMLSKWPPVAIKHVKCGWSTARGAVGVKHTGFRGLRMKRKN